MCGSHEPLASNGRIVLGSPWHHCDEYSMAYLKLLMITPWRHDPGDASPAAKSSRENGALPRPWPSRLRFVIGRPQSCTNFYRHEISERVCCASDSQPRPSPGVFACLWAKQSPNSGPEMLVAKSALVLRSREHSCSATWARTRVSSVWRYRPVPGSLQ